MGGVGKLGIQRYASDLSDALDIFARAPVHSWAIFMFWPMLEFDFRYPYCQFSSVQFSSVVSLLAAKVVPAVELSVEKSGEQRVQ